ncbi:MAG: DUF2249 domain-containing protein [Verrucomicrobia bacterium]|nr:DUF2249 domain-containing protein [Verrucomicrobiota bacterium]
MKTTEAEQIIDVRNIPPRQKHPTIFNTWTALPEGDAVLLVNDHDPIPLYYQFAAEYQGRFQWEYLERGPETWRVRIRKGAFASPGFVPGKAAPPDPPEPLQLDVRPVLERGDSPCASIDGAVAKLKPGQGLVLLAPFEPRPLFAKLGRDGFTHVSRQMEDGSWRIEFQRSGDAASDHGSCAHESPPCSSVGDASREGDIHIDARDLEPPEPLIRTLEAMAHLKKGHRLTMRSNRKPMHLFTQLDERGFAYDCTEQSDHSFLTEIWHADESTASSNCGNH